MHDLPRIIRVRSIGLEGYGAMGVYTVLRRYVKNKFIEPENGNSYRAIYMEIDEVKKDRSSITFYDRGTVRAQLRNDRNFLRDIREWYGFMPLNYLPSGYYQVIFDLNPERKGEWTRPKDVDGLLTLLGLNALQVAQTGGWHWPYMLYDNNLNPQVKETGIIFQNEVDALMVQSYIVSEGG